MRSLGGRIYTTNHKCHSQVIDLMRLCLVFGLPLPHQECSGEDNSDESVPQTATSADLADVACAALRVGVRSSGRTANGRGIHAARTSTSCLSTMQK